VPRIVLPTLSDGVVTLRPGRAEDAGALVAACQDPEIPRWTRVPSPYARADALRFLTGVMAEAESGAAAGLAAVDAGGALLGSFGVVTIDRHRGVGEVGYWVAREARGRGVAARAVRLLCAWALCDLGLQRLEIVSHRDNAASIRVAERAGFTATGELRAVAEDAGRVRDYRVFAAPSDA
jgi:RimJ/RimL family protein N-acetyltransferase